MLIDVEIFNRKAILLGDAWKEELPDLLNVEQPGYWFTPYARHGWDGKIKFLNARGQISAGLLLARRRSLKKLGFRFKFVLDHRTAPKFKETVKLPALKGTRRQYQEDAVAAMVENSNCGGIVLNATGTGKTVIMAIYLAKLLGSACVIVDDLGLLDQTRASFAHILKEEIGQVGAGVFNPKRITVATCQTLDKHKKKAKFRKWFNALDVALIDELHVQLNKRSAKILSTINAKAVFGFTATLEMDDLMTATKAQALCGKVVYKYPYAQGVEDGFLAPGVVLQVLHSNPKLGAQGDMLGDEYTPFTVGSKAWNNTVVELARYAVSQGRRVLILIDRQIHIRRLSKKLKSTPHDIIYGKVKRTGRTDAKKRFLSREIDLLIASSVFQKGQDLPPLDCVIDAACMSSRNNAIQKFGRGTRPAEGKKGFLYFDCGYAATDRRKGQPRLVSATRNRRRAFKREGIWIAKIDAAEPAKVIYRTAVELLDSYLS